MALIACPECQREISEKAAACPHCGSPTQSTPIKVETAAGAVVTTQATGRSWKIIQLIGALLITAGVVSCSAGDPGSAASLLMLGFVVFIAGRIGAWWKHG